MARKKRIEGKTVKLKPKMGKMAGGNTGDNIQRSFLRVLTDLCIIPFVDQVNFIPNILPELCPPTTD